MVVRLLALSLTVAFLLAGCESSSPNSGLGKKVGKGCSVQFRRGDALGGGGSNPVPPTTGSMNGAEVSLNGTLAAVEGDWVVMKPAVGDHEIWIPRASILLIQF